MVTVRSLSGEYSFQQATYKLSSVAVNVWDGDFTYAKPLDFPNEGLATFLLQQGVDLEVRTRISFENSKWTITTLVSIALTAEICVALDANSPMPTS